MDKHIYKVLKDSTIKLYKDSKKCGFSKNALVKSIQTQYNVCIDFTIIRIFIKRLQMIGMITTDIHGNYYIDDTILRDFDSKYIEYLLRNRLSIQENLN